MGHGWRTASATVLAFGLTGGAAAETRPSIAVVVHNQSAVSDDCIARAKADVVRIYGDAGVDVLWMDPAMVMPVPTFTIRLLIRPRPIEAHATVAGSHSRLGPSSITLLIATAPCVAERARSGILRQTQTFAS